MLQSLMMIYLYTRPALSNSEIGLIGSPPNHAREIVVREALGVVRMLRAVVANEIMRQLVAKRDPPVRHGFDETFRAGHVPLVELLEEAQITEDASVLVERDGAALLVGEDV